MSAEIRPMFMLLGMGGAGKSTLTIQYTKNQFLEEYDPTIMDVYSREGVMINGRQCTVDVLDEAGREFWAWSNYVKGFLPKVSGYVVVFDVTSRMSFDDVNINVSAVRKEVEQMKLPVPPIVICGNKTDKEGRVVTEQEGQDLAKRLNAKYTETSAKQHGDVEALFTLMIDTLFAPEKKKKTTCSVM